jgi:endonuclease IV
VRVLLETPAVAPAEAHYSTPDGIAALFRQLRDEVDPRLERFGLCVDTAHLWCSGVDLAGYAAAEGWFERLERLAPLLPPEAVALHLNDSGRPLGVGPDRHAPLARGHIWGGYRARLQESGLAAVLDYARRHGVPAILERSGPPAESHAALLEDYRLLRPLVGAGTGPGPAA